MKYIFFVILLFSYSLGNDYAKLKHYKEKMKNNFSGFQSTESKSDRENYYQIRFKNKIQKDLSAYSLELQKVVADEIFIYKYTGKDQLDIKQMQNDPDIESIKPDKRYGFTPF